MPQNIMILNFYKIGGVVEVRLKKHYHVPVCITFNKLALKVKDEIMLNLSEQVAKDAEVGIPFLPFKWYLVQFSVL